ncbi:hypothetical protein EVAR_55359_1 [Eumeta japonica]|uniref:Uncharacterized protein n=1 Tax=Eumeta variegata TaxID=151549 RepID=A0A4C1YS42_EUMVA|nr:hypothetical protein EVAR_55359_1 [Eumeta japonica]
MLRHDDASSRTAALTVNFSQENLKHPLNSPDFAISVLTLKKTASNICKSGVLAHIPFPYLNNFRVILVPTPSSSNNYESHRTQCVVLSAPARPLPQVSKAY